MTFRRWLQRTLNRMRGIPLVLAALTLVACASPPATFTAEPGLEEATRAAVEGWERALPCPIHVEYVSQGADVVVSWRVVPEREEGVRVFGEGGIHGNELGPWGHLDSWVYVDPETPADALGVVVAHEMGHALRGDHSAYRRDLMYAHYHEGMPTSATARDGRAVCQAWGYE
jgi:predicted Zn-dependent protease